MDKLSLPWPVSTPCTINQAFGVNGAYYQANGINILGHNGLDINTYHGQPVYASHDGYALYEIDDKQGHGITIRSKEQALLFGKPSFYKTVYWHICDPTKEPKYASPLWKKKEVEVKMGDLIGYADNTGLSTGDHLHFALKPIAQNAKKKWYNTRQNNGYGGCIDPSFYMSKFSAPSLIIASNVVEMTENILVHVQELPVESQNPPLKGLLGILDTLARWLR